MRVTYCLLSFHHPFAALATITLLLNEINNIYDRKVEYDLENIIINDESMAYINVLNPFIYMDKLYPYLDIKKI